MAKYDLSFIELLIAHRRGEVANDADAALTDLISAIRDNGGKGSIAVKMEFKQNKAGQLECTPKVEVKAPRRPLAIGIYYASDDGRPSRRDPNQADIEDIPGVSRMA